MVRFPSHLTVDQAAGQLGVSPRRVRQLVESNALRGDRFGSQWMIDAAHVRDVVRQGRPSGRPLSAENAWKILALASGVELPRGVAADGSRLLRLLQSRSLMGLAPALARRGRAVRLSVHAGLQDDFAADDVVVLSGEQAAGAHHFDLVAPNGVEGYVRAGDLEGLQQRYAAEAAEDGNVLLRVRPDDVWIPPGKHAPRAAAALDLLESRNPRSQQAGRAAIESIDAELTADAR